MVHKFNNKLWFTSLKLSIEVIMKGIQLVFWLKTEFEQWRTPYPMLNLALPAYHNSDRTTNIYDVLKISSSSTKLSTVIPTADLNLWRLQETECETTGTFFPQDYDWWNKINVFFSNARLWKDTRVETSMGETTTDGIFQLSISKIVITIQSLWLSGQLRLKCKQQNIARIAKTLFWTLSKYNAKFLRLFLALNLCFGLSVVETLVIF